MRSRFSQGATKIGLRFCVVGLAALFACAGVSAAGGVQVIGYLGNFDVYNNTGSEMEGFEISMRGLHISDLNPAYPTYCGSAFGCGNSYNTASGLSVVYDGNNANPSYFWQRQSVPNGGVTHFGVHLTSGPTETTYNWLDRNVADHQLYIAGTSTLAAGQSAPPVPPAPAPVPQPVVITPDWTLSGATLSAVIKNTTNRPIWVQGVSAEDTTAVTLDQLMATNPLFAGLPMAEAQLLDPNDSLTEAGDLSASSFGGRAMFWIYSYSGPVRITDVVNGVNVYGQDCSATVGGCVFNDMHGSLQSRMMTSVSVGEVSAVPEPETYSLLLVGVLFIGFATRGHKTFGATRANASR